MHGYHVFHRENTGEGGLTKQGRKYNNHKIYNNQKSLFRVLNYNQFLADILPFYIQLFSVRIAFIVSEWLEKL